MRRIPDDNLSYPFSIALASGAQGTGFVVNADPHLYLVTARHVLFAGKTLLSDTATVTGYNRTIPASPPVVLKLSLDALLVAKQLRPHATSDVAVAHIATLGPPIGMIRSLAFTAGVSTVNAAGVNLVGVDLKYHVKRFANVLEATK